MRRLEHCNIVKLKYFFYSSGEKVSFRHPRYPWSKLTNEKIQSSNLIKKKKGRMQKKYKKKSSDEKYISHASLSFSI